MLLPLSGIQKWLADTGKNVCWLIFCPFFPLFVFRFNTMRLKQITSEHIISISSFFSLSTEDKILLTITNNKPWMLNLQILTSCCVPMILVATTTFWPRISPTKQPDIALTWTTLEWWMSKISNFCSASTIKRPASMLQYLRQLISINSLPLTDTWR